MFWYAAGCIHWSGLSSQGRGDRSFITMLHVSVFDVDHRSYWTSVLVHEISLQFRLIVDPPPTSPTTSADQRNASLSFLHENSLFTRQIMFRVLSQPYLQVATFIVAVHKIRLENGRVRAINL